MDRRTDSTKAIALTSRVKAVDNDKQTDKQTDRHIGTE